MLTQIAIYLHLSRTAHYYTENTAWPSNINALQVTEFAQTNEHILVFPPCHASMVTSKESAGMMAYLEHKDCVNKSYDDSVKLKRTEMAPVRLG